jgi:hypothetical protein
MGKLGAALGGGMIVVAISCGSSVDVPAAASGASGPGGAATTGAGTTTSGSGGAGGASTEKLLWARRFGGDNVADGQAITMDEAGDVVVTGEFRGTLDFGAPLLHSNGLYDAFVAKLSGAAGDPIWRRQLGAKDLKTNGTSIASDAAGNVFVAGVTNSVVDFGGGPRCAPSLHGTDRSFLIKLDPQGNHVFSQCFGDDVHPTGSRAWVAVDSAGNSFLAGGISLDSQSFDDPSNNAFVHEFDPSGNPVWSRELGGSAGWTSAWGVATDAAGNVLVGGVLDGTLDLGNGVITSGVDSVDFLVKLDSSGNPLWERGLLSAVGGNHFLGLATQPSGHVVMAGEPFTGVAFGGGQTEAQTGMVASFEQAGGLAWARALGGPYAEERGIASKDNGELFVIGSPDRLAPAMESAISLAHLDASGKPLSITSFSVGVGTGIAVHGDRVAITGWAGATIDFGAGPLPSLNNTGNGDIFVAVLGP